MEDKTPKWLIDVINKRKAFENNPTTKAIDLMRRNVDDILKNIHPTVIKAAEDYQKIKPTISREAVNRINERFFELGVDEAELKEAKPSESPVLKTANEIEANLSEQVMKMQLNLMQFQIDELKGKESRENKSFIKAAILAIGASLVSGLLVGLINMCQPSIQIQKIALPPAILIRDTIFVNKNISPVNNVILKDSTKH